MNKIREILIGIKSKVEKKFLKLLTGLSLSLTYFLGIGLTALIGKLFSKEFLPLIQKNSGSPRASSWTPAKYQTRIGKMF